MITFRYHVVTLVAVFMAIGLGVLFGATFIDQNIVAGLEATQVRLGTRNETLRKRILEQEKQNEALTAFASSVRDQVVRGALEGRPVLLLSMDSTPGDVLDAAEATLNVAGARLMGRLTLSDELDLRAEDARKRLAAALGTTSTQPVALSELLVAQITGELLGKNPPVIQKLIDNGLAGGQMSPITPPVEGQPVASPAVVLVAGKTSKELNDRLVIPLVESLAEGSVVAAVAEAGPEEKILRPLRERSIQVVTVDNAETAVSQAALATGLRTALGGQFGTYGTGEGATTIMPSAPAE
jgi:copper transport outer membrane protein MctB